MSAINLDAQNSNIYSEYDEEVSLNLKKIMYVIAGVLVSGGFTVLGLTIAGKVPVYAYSFAGGLAGIGALMFIVNLYFNRSRSSSKSVVEPNFSESARQSFDIESVYAAISSQIGSSMLENKVEKHQSKLDKLTKIAIQIGFFEMGNRTAMELSIKKMNSEIDKLHAESAINKADLASYGKAVIKHAKNFLILKSN